MGLPGSGKTTFAESLKRYIEENSSKFQLPVNRLLLEEHISLPVWNASVEWFNADEVRRKFDDWDFSETGRIRQSMRMLELAMASLSDFVICDFVAPLPEMRRNFNADWVIWMDTVDEGRFSDTNKLFVPPDRYDFRIIEKDVDKWVPFVAYKILSNQKRPIFDWRKETVQMLGRWQPWHAGHQALFERAIKKTGQVCIMIRDCKGWNKSNPFDVEFVKNRIRRNLDPLYQGMYEIMVVPNIVNITYGRDVGYSIEQELFGEHIHSISATKIRKEMGIE